ncbi:hypothetical protein GQ55_6G205400 [Panicum hallii var. hallii]|uniref:Uncharacterized protein n=1 Tax=Panicum hallii var. hallii TaxID=1504633 RepID=A0A2T7D7V8_9POAL|nr:hypothetical protein GQ55_6G205400 [Panicum hallii var. hallii]
MLMLSDSSNQCIDSTILKRRRQSKKETAPQPPAGAPHLLQWQRRHSLQLVSLVSFIHGDADSRPATRRRRVRTLWAAALRPPTSMLTSSGIVRFTGSNQFPIHIHRRDCARRRNERREGDGTRAAGRCVFESAFGL